MAKRMRRADADLTAAARRAAPRPAPVPPSRGVITRSGTTAHLVARHRIEQREQAVGLSVVDVDHDRAPLDAAREWLSDARSSGRPTSAPPRPPSSNKPPCPGCGSKDWMLTFSRFDNRYHLCESCSYRW